MPRHRSFFARSAALQPLVALCITVGAARADWSPDPYIGGLALSSTSGVQSFPCAIPDGSGGLIVAWQDLRNGSDFDIFAQHVDAHGQVLWTTNGVPICAVTNTQSNAVIVSDGAGGAIITWQDFRSASNYDVYAQRVNANGTVAWAANGVVISNATNNQDGPVMISDDAGGAIIAWQDFRNGANYDLYAQRVGPTGAVQWTANGRAVAVAGNAQQLPKMVSDGANGVILAWQDARAATVDVYAQRLASSGTPQWTVDGLVVCNAAGNQIAPVLVSDLVGGATIAWEDQRTGVSDIYAQRLAPTGTILWPANGAAVSNATNGQITPAIASDGSGGAILAWVDFRNAGTAPDIYTQRMTAAGTGAWFANGMQVNEDANGTQLGPLNVMADGVGGAWVAWSDARSLIAYDLYLDHFRRDGSRDWDHNALVGGAVSDQYAYALVTDAARGAYVAWSDFRSGTSKTYAQRVNSGGPLGDCAPKIVSVRDVPNDQGGTVNLRFNASRLDDMSTDDNPNYQIWRQIPNAAALAAISKGVKLVTSDRAAAAVIRGERAIRETVDLAGVTYYWEVIDWLNGTGMPTYARVIQTTSDSLPGSNPRTLFRVETAVYLDGNYFYYSSDPDSGYSVDNLPPGSPGLFTAQYAAGTTALHWAKVTASDLAGYRLYRGGTTSFVPGPGNLVAALSDTGYSDAAGGPYIYKLTAVDSHGNQSPVATVAPSGVLDAPNTSASIFFLAAPMPNPARSSDGVTLKFGLSRAGEARLRVFDAQGRLVRTLSSGVHAAGAQSARWDGRDDRQSPLSSGLYFVRLEAESRVATTRVALLW